MYLLVYVFSLYGCEESSTTDVLQTSGTTEQPLVEVVEVTDSDTIKVKYNGNMVKVRYLLIDTPETNHHNLRKHNHREDCLVKLFRLVAPVGFSRKIDGYYLYLSVFVFNKNQEK